MLKEQNWCLMLETWVKRLILQRTQPLFLRNMRAQSLAFITKSSDFVPMNGVLLPGAIRFFLLSYGISLDDMEILGKSSIMMTNPYDICTILKRKNTIIIDMIS